MKDLKIDSTKTALVLIDLQKGILSRPAAPHSTEEVLKNAVSLTEACRSQSMPVFLVHVSMSPDLLDGLHPIVDKSMQLPAQDTTWADIVPELGPKEGDFLITKHQWGAFYGTELDLQLRRRKKDTIILGGISTNIGVESTARFAYEFGYNQIFAEDAMSAMSLEDHSGSVERIFPRLGLVRSTEEILAALV
jgi:nicotinamidase-related amidase